MIYGSSWLNRFEIKPGRWVYNPTPEARKNGSIIVGYLNTAWEKPSYYYHLRDGGHVAALRVHEPSHYFATIDLQDFFGHISRSRVTRALKSIVGYKAARKVAKISTVKAPEGYPHSHYLPYGFVQSPLLSAISLFDSSLGQLLESFNKRKNVVVSVYMDDIVISSNDEKTLKQAYDSICSEAVKSKFVVNTEKSRPVSTMTEAFNINISNGVMEITEKRFATFHYFYTLPSTSVAQKKGIGSYVGSVNKNQAKNLQ